MWISSHLVAIIGITILIGLGIVCTLGCVFPEYQAVMFGGVGAAVVLSGVAVAWRQLSAMRGSMESQLVMNLVRYWDSEPLIEAREKVKALVDSKQDLCQAIEDYRDTDFREYLKLLRVPNFFEDMGWLVRGKYIRDAEAVLGIFYDNVVNYYNQYGEYIERQQLKEPKVYEYFKELAKLAMRY